MTGAEKSKTDARRREVGYELLALLMLAAGALAGGWAALTPLDSTVAAENRITSGPGTESWLTVAWPVPFALFIAAVLFYVAAAVAREGSSPEAPAPGVSMDAAGEGAGRKSDERTAVEFEPRIYPPEDVDRCRARELRIVWAGYGTTFFLGAAVWRFAGSATRPAESLVDDPAPFLYLLAGVLLAMYGVRVLLKRPTWPCPACGGRTRRAARQSPRGTVLRDCRRCQIDWDTGEDPYEGGGGNGGGAGG